MKKLALAIGVNRYANLPGATLAGCINDALDWAEALRALGYEVVVLLDEQATAAGIRAALRDLVARARRGDRIVVTNSSHGTRVRDLSGDEADGLDEAICPHDVAQAGVITDDELQALLGARAYGVRAVLVSDSCHSGTLHRFADFLAFQRSAVDATEAGVPLDLRPRFLDPALVPDSPTRPAARSTGARALRPPVLLLAGARDDEFAFDAVIDGRPRGPMTAACLAALAELGPTATWAQVLDAARDRHLDRARYPQTPTLQATTAQRRWRVSA